MLTLHKSQPIKLLRSNLEEWAKRHMIDVGTSQNGNKFVFVSDVPAGAIRQELMIVTDYTVRNLMSSRVYVLLKTQ